MTYTKRQNTKRNGTELGYKMKIKRKKSVRKSSILPEEILEFHTLCKKVHGEDITLFDCEDYVFRMVLFLESFDKSEPIQVLGMDMIDMYCQKNHDGCI